MGSLSPGEAAVRRKPRSSADDEELTDFEFAMTLDSACPTRVPTRSVSRQFTPLDVDPPELAPIRIRELGSGAYGVVHLAVDRMNGDFLAVKSFNPPQRTKKKVSEGETPSEFQARRDFIRELQAMHKLNHVSQILTAIGEIPSEFAELSWKANIVQLRRWRESES